MSNAITCECLSVGYAGKVVLENINLSFRQNAITGFLGENGVGKTTLIKAIVGILSYAKGEVSIYGNPIKTQKDRNSIGVIFEGEDNAYKYMSVMDNLIYFGLLAGFTINKITEQADKLVHFFGIEQYLNTFYGKLSRGTKQKVLIVIALIRNPKILILDEPTLGLDIPNIKKLSDQLRQLSMRDEMSIFIASHDSAFIDKTCDDVIFLDKGEIKYSGSVVEFKRKYSEKKLFNVEVYKDSSNDIDGLSLYNNLIEKNDSIIIKGITQDMFHNIFENYDVISVDSYMSLSEVFIEATKR